MTLNKEEMQVLAALETGLECAEAVLASEQTSNVWPNDQAIKWAQKDVELIKVAIGIVERWGEP